MDLNLGDHIFLSKKGEHGAVLKVFQDCTKTFYCNILKACILHKSNKITLQNYKNVLVTIPVHLNSHTGQNLNNNLKYHSEKWNIIFFSM